MSMKKLLCVVLAVLMLASVAISATSCANTDDPASDNTADTTTATPAGDNADTQAPEGNDSSVADTTAPEEIDTGLPEGLDFDGQTISFLIWSDHTMNEFYMDDITGDLIGDEIHERNEVVKEALDVILTYTEEPGDSSDMTSFIKKAETDINSGACEYDIIAGYSRTAPAMALDGNLCELTELKYLDFSQPWWPSALIDECTIHDNLFFCSGDISTNLLWMMTATFFNKDKIDQYGLEDPYVLVQNNKWTIDKMAEMTANKYNDVDGGGTKDVSDEFGHIIYNINVDAFFTSSGFIALEKNTDGDLIASPTMTSEKTYDVIDKMGEYLNTPDVYFKDDTSIRNIFFEQRAIFTTDRVFIVAGKDNGKQGKIEFEYGIIPVAKYDSTQEEYYTSVGHPFTMYAISIGAKDADLDGISATLQLLAAESYKRVTPAVFESAMKVKYASDNTASEMYDILRSNIRFDLGRLYSSQVGDVYKVMRNQAYNNSKTFASQYKGLSRVINKGIETISAAFDK